MPYSGEADAANILLVLLLLAGQPEYCTDSPAAPIPAISPIGSPSGKVRSDNRTYMMRLRASRKCRSARPSPLNTDSAQPTEITIESERTGGLKSVRAARSPRGLSAAQRLGNRQVPVCEPAGEAPDVVSLNRGTNEKLLLVEARARCADSVP